MVSLSVHHTRLSIDQSVRLSSLQVKNKMSAEGFLKNNRGINDGADLDPEFMRALYDRIVNNEIKVRFWQYTSIGKGVVQLNAQTGFGAAGGLVSTHKAAQHLVTTLLCSLPVTVINTTRKHVRPSLPGAHLPIQPTLCVTET